MLTQSDLQAIGKIFEVKFDSRFTGIEKRLSSLETKMGLFESNLSSLDKKMNRGFKLVERKLNLIINYFDHQDIDIRKRLNRIELHLGIVPLNS